MLNLKTILITLFATLGLAATSRYLPVDGLNAKGQASIATPASGYYSIGVKSSDGKLYRKNSSGTEVTYQPEDAELTALASVTSAADKIPYFTGSGTAGLVTIGSGLTFSSGTLAVSGGATTTNPGLLTAKFAVDNSNYWLSNSNGSYADLTQTGTPTFASFGSTVGFTSVGAAASSRPGIALTTPNSAGKLEVCFTAAGNGSTSPNNYEVVETGSGTVVAYLTAGYTTAGLGYTSHGCGYYSVSASTAYEFKIKGKQSGGAPTYIGNDGTMDAGLLMTIKYVSW